MYFDHVRCPHCGAQFPPERLDNASGAMCCPGCSAQLDVKALFGLAAHLAEAEDEDPAATLNDLVPGGAPSTPVAPTPGGSKVLDVLRELKRDR